MSDKAHAVVEITLVGGLIGDDGEMIEATMGGTTVVYMTPTDSPPADLSSEVMSAAMAKLIREPAHVIDIAMGVLGFVMVGNPLPGNRLVDALEPSATRPAMAVDLHNQRMSSVSEGKA